MHVSGVFLGAERKNGTFTNDAGKDQSYDYTVLNVLDGMRVRQVRLPQGVHVHPFAEGEPVDLGVDVAQNVKITIDPASLVRSKAA